VFGLVFFFSSRRRHTRFSRDWSSDVCSSDLTHMGKRFVDADLNERKEIFSRALMNHVPLAAHIRKVLDERASHSAPRTRFLDELGDHMDENTATDTLKCLEYWPRFAGLFSYDDGAELFSLENPT